MVSDILKSTPVTVLWPVHCKLGNFLLVLNGSLVQMKILSEILNLKKNYQSVSAKYYQANEAIQKIKISHILREIWQHFSGGLIEEWWTCIEQVECISGHWKMRKKFFSVRTAEHGKRLPRMTVECPSLEMLKNCLDTILSNMPPSWAGRLEWCLPTFPVLWFFDSGLHPCLLLSLRHFHHITSWISSSYTE